MDCSALTHNMLTLMDGGLISKIMCNKFDLLSDSGSVIMLSSCI